MSESIIKILIFMLSPIGIVWGVIEFIKLRKEKPPTEAEEKEED